MNATFVFEQSESTVTERVEALLSARLDRVAHRSQQQVIENISRPARDQKQPMRRPGGFPHVDGGLLRKSISVDVAEPSVRRVLTDTPHGLLLETGTRDMQPHPYLTRSLDELSAELASIINEGSTA
jgi:hypothetical protein